MTIYVVVRTIEQLAEVEAPTPQAALMRAYEKPDEEWQQHGEGEYEVLRAH